MVYKDNKAGERMMPENKKNKENEHQHFYRGDGGWAEKVKYTKCKRCKMDIVTLIDVKPKEMCSICEINMLNLNLKYTLAQVEDAFKAGVNIGKWGNNPNQYWEDYKREKLDE